MRGPDGHHSGRLVAEDPTMAPMRRSQQHYPQHELAEASYCPNIGSAGTAHLNSSQEIVLRPAAGSAQQANLAASS